MKHVLTIFALFAATAAVANGYTPPAPPPPAPAPVAQPVVTGQQGQQQQQQQQAEAEAAAAAKAAAEAAAKAKSDADADANSYGAGGNVLSKNNSLLLNFPQPVWTVIPEAKGKCIVSFSEADSYAWSFYSTAESGQKSDAVCVLEAMFVSAMNNCHFLSAELIRNRNLGIITPGLPELPLTPGVRNLTHEECDAFRRPRLQPSYNIVTYKEAPPAPAPIVAPAPAPVQKKAAPKKAKPRKVKPKCNCT